VAAGHRAVDHAAIAMMFAVHRRFRGSYLPWLGLIHFRVSMRHAHAAFAAGHSVRVPRRRLHGRPEQHNG
jgi:hypothetical protein